MPKKQSAQPQSEVNRVWIELEKPRDAVHAARICEKANRMLARLADDMPANSEFAWSEHRAMYMYGTSMGYKYLTDRGEWFNLDYVGRES